MQFVGFTGCTGLAGVPAAVALCDNLTEIGPEAGASATTRLGWFFGDLAPAAVTRSVALSYDAVVLPTGVGGAPVNAGAVLTNRIDNVWNLTDKVTTPPATVPAPGAYDVTDPGGPYRVNITVIEPALTLDKRVAGQVGDSDDRTADVDATLNYAVTLTNGAGANVADAYDAVVTDVVPAGLGPPTAINAGGTYDAPTRTITWTVPGPLAPGASLALTYSTVVGDSAAFGTATRLTNTATPTRWWGVGLTERSANPGPRLPQLQRPRRPGHGHARLPRIGRGQVVVGSRGRARAVHVDRAPVQHVDRRPRRWAPTSSTRCPPTGPTCPASARLDGAGAPEPTVTGAQLRWTDLVDLAPGGSATLTYQAVPSWAARAGAAANTVTVTAEDADGHGGNVNGPYTATDVDSPVLGGASVGDLVWEDLDGNGRQDTGEPGVAGVPVTLDVGRTRRGRRHRRRPEPVGRHRRLRAATSSRSLPAGAYTMSFGTVGAHVRTIANSPVANNANDSDPDAGTGQFSMALTAGQARTDVDAGLYTLVALGHRVWVDVNGDGIQTPGEPGLPGVTVTLTGYGPDGVPGGTDDFTMTTTTASDGTYGFTGLRPGNYDLAFSAPAGYRSTEIGHGTPTTDSDPIGGHVPLTLVSGKNRPDVDAGLFLATAIGDRVWYDLDADGRQDPGEPGVAGVTVDLLRGLDLIATTTTVAGGGYSFTGIDPGTYTVQVRLPANLVPTTPNVGPPEATDSDIGATGVTAPITLPSDTTDLDEDAGLVGAGSIGDLVWEDLDGDGAVDPGEPGIAGVTLTLTWGGPDGVLGGADDAVVGSATTAPNGTYGFGRLPPGAYRVDSGAPSMFVPTYDADGPATPSTATVSSAAVQARADIDFGYRREADVSITKRADDTDVYTGNTVTFTLDVSNAGPAPAVTPLVVDTLPTGLTYVAAAAPGWTCTNVSATVTCDRDADLPSGASDAITVQATVDTGAPATLLNGAVVSSATFDPDTADNDAETTLTATEVADLRVTKSHPAGDPVLVGRTQTYTIVVSNAGPSVSVGTMAEPIRIHDPLPDGLVPTAVAAADRVGRAASAAGMSPATSSAPSPAARRRWPSPSRPWSIRRAGSPPPAGR